MRSLLLSILFLFSVIPGFSQIEILNSKVFTEKTFVKTYVILNNANENGAEPYKKVFSDYWKLTPVEFIESTDYFNKIEPNTLYFSFNEMSTGAETVNSDLGNRTVSQTIPGNAYYVMELSAVKDKYFEKLKGQKNKKNSISSSDLVTFARIYLGFETDTSNYKGTFSRFYVKYDGANRFSNWKPGFIKNYLQQLQKDLANPVNKSATDFYSNPDALKALQTETLYTEDEKFVKYPYKKIELSADELSNKILDKSQKPFFYLMSISLVMSEFTYVVNSSTGEIVFQLEHPRNRPYMINKLVKNINK